MGLLSAIIGLFNSRIAALLDPPKYPKDDNPIKFGILGAANIAPRALILPALFYPGAIVVAVAARDERRARAFANKHGIPKVFQSYQDMLDDPSIDAIYNPLPNGLHYEWTMKALKAGKHVLLEKPSTNRSSEAKEMFALAKEKNLVLLEAFHYQFHPANHRLKEIVASGELGALKSISTELVLPKGYFANDDIRFKYDLGGGALMDLGCYTVSWPRFITGSEPAVLFATVERRPQDDERVDRSIKADLKFNSEGDSPPVLSQIHADLAMPWRFGIIPRFPLISAKLVCERGRATLFNFPGPFFYHKITIHEKDKPVRTEQAYTFPDLGESWWSTYMYQLDAFVKRIRGQEPHHWVTAEDSIAQMKVIEEIYEKAGLPQRPLSSYKA